MYKLIGIFILVGNVVIGQLTRVDSLKSELKKNLNDTLKCKILYELAETAPDIEWEQYNRELKTLALKNNESNLKFFYSKYLAAAINNEGVILQDEGDNFGALKKYRESYLLSNKINDKSSVASELNNIGTIHERMGNLDSATLFYEQSYKICEVINDLKGASNSLSNIGSIYGTKGNYNEALNYYNKSLMISTKIKDLEGEALSLSKVAAIQCELKEFDYALKNFDRCIKIREDIQDLSGLIEICNSVGAVYFVQKKFREAKVYFLKALSTAYAVNNKNRIAFSLINISNILKVNGKDDQAIDSLLKSNAIYISISDASQCIALYKIAEIYLSQSKYAEAKKYALSALNIAKEKDQASELVIICKTLLDLYKKTGDYKSALEINELYLSAVQKIYNEENVRKSYQIQYKYEYDQKTFKDSLKQVSDKQVFEIKLKQERANFYLSLVGIVFFMVIGLLLFQQYRQKQRQSLLELRNKIANDLHDDIGSALSSIKLLAGITKTNPDKAKEYELISKIEQTSLETITNMNDIIWSVNAKNDSLNVVIDKMTEFGEKICYAANIKFELKSDGAINDSEVDMIQRKNIYLIFKEAVNNAVKYAGASQIIVSIGKGNGKILLSIKDDGRGFSLSEVSSKGNGLESMKSRAKEANGIITISSSDTGTTIFLEIKTT